MTTYAATLTETQKFVLSSGKAMANELGLTELTYTNPAEVQLSEGQTVLLATPNSVTVDTVTVDEREYEYPSPNKIYTDYLLNGEVIFRTAKRLVGEEYVPQFEPRLYVPSGSQLYVS